MHASVDGTQGGADGLKGHTLVFINVLTVLNGAEGDTPTDHTGERFLVYQYPTTRIDTDAILEEGGKEVNQIQSMLEDTAEMIYLSRSDTSILSAQTKRKGGMDESIIYAGMYLDDSFSSGGGAVKQTLTDTIYYENLQSNKTYYVKGYLVDRDTGNLAVDADRTYWHQLWKFP